METQENKIDLEEKNMDNENLRVESEMEESEQDDKYFEQLQRLQAEFDNYVKRTDKEKGDVIKTASEGLIIQLLSVLDNFELALKHNEDKGVNMIYSELYTILEKEGVKPIEAVGRFNPKYHEVLIQEEGDEDDVIVAELQKGYMLGDKVIRAAKVKISKLGENKNE
jgi:molecular chaperone GrpE